MELLFSDRPREGFVQDITENDVKLYIHGVGFRVVKMEQLKVYNHLHKGLGKCHQTEVNVKVRKREL